MIKGKYGEDQGGWCSKEVRGGYGVGMNLFVFLFPHLLWLSSRMLGLKMCGIAMRVGGLGACFFPDRLMIGSWMRYADSFWA